MVTFSSSVWLCNGKKLFTMCRFHCKSVTFEATQIDYTTVAQCCVLTKTSNVLRIHYSVSMQLC